MVDQPVCIVITGFFSMLQRPLQMKACTHATGDESIDAHFLTALSTLIEAAIGIGTRDRRDRIIAIATKVDLALKTEGYLNVQSDFQSLE